MSLLTDCLLLALLELDEKLTAPCLESSIGEVHADLLMI